MKPDRKASWLKEGYELFARHGLSGLKVEVLAARVGVSKSSFYHHFADMEVFTNLLLQHHLGQARLIAQRERQCRCLDPDLLHLLLDVRTDLLFNRQLRVNRENRLFRECFEASTRLVTDAFLAVWTNDLGLTSQPGLAAGLLDVALDSFYLQLADDTLTQPGLAGYFQRLRQLVADFRNARAERPIGR